MCQKYWGRVTIHKWYCRKKNNSDESRTDGAFCENPKACERFGCKNKTCMCRGYTCSAYVEVTHVVHV